MSGVMVADRRLHPGTMALRLVKSLPQMLIGSVFFARQFEELDWWAVPFAAVLAIAVMLAVAWLRWRCFRYGVGPGGILIEHGWISRTRRSIPFDRIQDVDMERGPLHRLFRLAKVRIETGGSGGDEGVLDSVDLGEVDRLRAAVREGQAALRGDGVSAAPSPLGVPAGADDAAEAERPIFVMDMRRVLLLGLFNFSLIYIAGFYAVLNFVGDWLPFGWGDARSLLGEARHRVEDGAVTPSLVLFAISVAVLLGVVAVLARTVARDHGFRLTSGLAGFRRERGLFTRTEVMIPRRRVQLGLIESGPVREWLGWFSLVFQTLSEGDGGKGSDAEKGRQPVAPLASQTEIATIIDAAAPLRQPDRAGLQPVSRRHLVRVLVPRLLFPTMGLAIGGFFYPPVWFGLVVVAALASDTILERRRHRYALDGDMLFVQRGWWQQRLWLVPVASAQSVSLERSLWQRVLGLATVSVDTAGAARTSALDVQDLRLDDAIVLRDAIRQRMIASRNGSH